MFAGTHQECHARRCYRDRICSQRQRGRFPPSRCCAEGAARLGTHAAWRRTFASNAGLFCGNGCTLHLLALYQRSESRSPSPPASLSLPPQHQMPISLTRWVRGGEQRLLQGSGPGWGKAALSGAGFSLPTLPGAGLDGQTGRKSLGSEEPLAERKRKESQGTRAGCAQWQPLCRSHPPGSPLRLLTYCLLAACFELTSAGAAPPASRFPRLMGSAPKLSKGQGKGPRGHFGLWAGQVAPGLLLTQKR